MKLKQAFKIGKFFNKCFSWIGKVKKASDSLALILEHGEMLKDDLDKIWINEKNINDSTRDVVVSNTDNTENDEKN